MKIFNLPDDILPKRELITDEIIMHHYLAPMGTFNGKSVLTKNAISLVISGEKTMHFAEKTVHIKKDEFHFLSAGNCLVSMNLLTKTPFRSMLVFFDNAALDRFFLKYNHKVAAIKDRKRIPSESYIALKKDAFILNFIDSLKLLVENSVPISAEMKYLKFEELLLHLLEKYPAHLLSFKTSKNKDLSDFEIRKAVETNITSAITLEEMAFLCNISISTFKRRFVKIYGTSPNKWILRKRMEIAKELLLHHARPSEVFYKVGYENHSSFTQSFKQTFGTTPKEFQLKQLSD